MLSHSHSFYFHSSPRHSDSWQGIHYKITKLSFVVKSNINKFQCVLDIFSIAFIFSRSIHILKGIGRRVDVVIDAVICMELFMGSEDWGNVNEGWFGEWKKRSFWSECWRWEYFDRQTWRFHKRLLLVKVKKPSYTSQFLVLSLHVHFLATVTDNWSSWLAN